MLAIQTENLTKIFDGKIAVNQVNLNVEQGNVIGILGAMGSGKTTLLRMICGLMKPTSGKIYCLEKELETHAKYIRENIGYLTQHFTLYSDLTIIENLKLIGRLYGVRDLNNVVNQSVERFGLESHANKYAGKLSGGWKKRLSFAASIIHCPKIVILDEPTAGVDPKSRLEFWDIIYEFAQQGMTVVVSTHYMDEAERCNHIYYLDKGHLKFTGKPKDLISEVNLATFHVYGDDLEQIKSQIIKYPFIVQVVRFGNVLHVSVKGSDQDKLNHLFSELGLINFEQRETSLEDAFIALTSKER